MALADSRLPIRLVICVDGTQAPSASDKSNGSQTNVHRIYAIANRDSCRDGLTGGVYRQAVKYFPGIGSAEDAFSKDRIQASVFGQGYLKQIQDVYESCCQLTGEKDDIWLFGFSRGAYVMRAVAGLLHQVGAVASAGQPEFAKDFKRILKEAERQQGLSGLALSPVCKQQT